MKVKELIEKLSEIDQEMDVVLAGYEGGYYDLINPPIEIEIALNYHHEDDWWYGRHELAALSHLKNLDKCEKKRVFLLN